jgi:sugar phosphate isomerase/epimerase
MNSRRSFIKVSSLASVGTLTGLAPVLGMNPLVSNGTRKVYVFSKHLQWLDYEEMAATSKKIGFDGIDLTVRPNGHVLPENVKKDLPKAIKAIKNNGLLADRMTIAATDPDDSITIDILETASKEGVTNYRMGWFAYNPSISVQKNIDNFRTKLLKFEKLNKDLGLVGDYQNHAGEMAGSPVWDMGLMLDGVNSDFVGIRYDIRHATVEGGTSWPLGLKFLANKINSFDVKDFIWKEINGKWKPYNVPIGEGMVDFDRYFNMLKELNIEGDFTLHLEYPLGGAENGKYELTCVPEKVISAMKQDLTALKKWI